jgi:hypothetical protein
MRFDDSWDDEPPIFRLYEDDGTVCVAWLPDEYPHGPLDGGGFDSRSDAQTFKLGVDYERALHGLIAESTDDIEAERLALESPQQ